MKNTIFSRIAVLAHLPNLSGNQTIIFDDVTLDASGSYNASSGHFRAPTRGVYMFYVNILSEAANFVETEVLLNGRGLVEVYSGAGRFNGAGNNMVITRWPFYVAKIQIQLKFIDNAT